jgi:hypothetical protein
VEDYEKLIELLANYDVARLPAILAVCLKQRSRTCKITERIQAAIDGEYRPSGQYSQKELDLALVSLRLGGYRLLYTLSHVYGLPSLRTLMRKHVSLHLTASVLGSEVEDMSTNLHEMVIRPRNNEQPRLRGSHIMIDETALCTSAFEAPGHRCVLGGQCSCRGLTEEGIKIRTGEDAIRIAEEMDRIPKESKHHYANQATTIAVSFFGTEDYRALPFSLSGTCGKKDSDLFIQQLAQILEAWDSSGCLEQFGPLWSVATDGDSSRRRGGFEALLKDDLRKDTPLGKKLWPLFKLGMNMKVGDETTGLTLDFDWKHIIKRMGTQIRSPKGMSLDGHQITSGLIARYLCDTGLPSVKIAAILEPHDPQNVIKAIELVDALNLIAVGTCSTDTSLDARNRQSIGVFAAIYGSFVTVFTDPSLSLSQQLALLSKYTHLTAYYFRKDKERFMAAQLYTDSMTCIKNAFFCVAKQQVLDPKQPFYLFQLGSDGVEKLFAGARMTGAHDSNFTLKELAQRLGHGMDIMRVFADHPEWYLAHQRMNTVRGEKADRLAPRYCTGNLTSGSVNLSKSWSTGAGNARVVISNFCKTARRPSPQTWSQFWSLEQSDILRPCGFTYPAVKFVYKPTEDQLATQREDPVTTEDISSRPEDAGSNSHVRAVLPDDIQVDNVHVHIQTILEDQVERGKQQEERAQASQEQWTQQAIASAAEPEEDESGHETRDATSSEAATPISDDIALEALSKKRKRSVWHEGRWLHIESLFRILFNEIMPGESHDRLLRVRTFLAPIVPEHLRALLQSAFGVGDCALTPIRVAKKAFLALVQVSHVYKSGKEVYNVSKDDLVNPAACVEVRGQILRLVPHHDGKILRWVWDQTVVKLRPVSDQKNARDLYDVRIPGLMMYPTTLPSTTRSDGQGDPEASLSFPHAALLGAQELLWDRIKVVPDFSSKIGHSGGGEGFPYSYEHSSACEGATNFEERRFIAPGNEGKHLCRHCRRTVPAAEIVSHIAGHVLRAQRGIPDLVHPEGIEVCFDVMLSCDDLLIILKIGGSSSCGFCGQDCTDRCDVFLKQKGKEGTIWIISTCPDFVDRGYGFARRSTVNFPGANVPIICTLCDFPKHSDGKRPAIWRYNFRQHILDIHPDYAVPGWPVGPNNSHPSCSEGMGGALLLPYALASLLNFQEFEEGWLGVSKSTPWTSLARTTLKRTADDDLDEDEPAAKRTSPT